MAYNNEPTNIDAELRKTLSSFYDFNQVELFALSSGMNNITRKFRFNDHYYHARIYCNHMEKQKVLFEHEVLALLHEQQLTIQIPTSVRTKHGFTVSALADGRLVSVFEFIEGEQSSSQELYISLIEATGHLSAALANIRVNMSESYSPYYDIKENYPPYCLAQINTLATKFKMDDALREQLITLITSRQTLESKREIFKRLPHQFIHGDINFSNSVTSQNQVIAILDFEFVTYDLRAMELAVLLTEYFKIYPAVDKHTFELCIDTFQAIRPLTHEELVALPSLVQLRAVDVAMHFLTRFVDGHDSLEVLSKIAEDCSKVVSHIDSLKHTIMNS